MPDVPEALLREVCSRHGIPKGDEFLVLDAFHKKSAPGACCGSDCRPCVLDIEAAEEELRTRLGSAKPGTSGSKRDTSGS